MLPFRPPNEAEPAKSSNEDYAYSHDAAVAAITSYYELIERVSSSHLKLDYPPSDGWPQITRASFASWGKTDAVIDLLRHIPSFGDDNIEIMRTTNPGHFTDPVLCEETRQASEVLRFKASSQPEQKERQTADDDADFHSDGFPRSMVLFAIGEEYGFKVHIDIKYGLVILAMNGCDFPRCESGFDGDMINPYIDWNEVEVQYQKALLQEYEDEDEDDPYGENDWKTIKSQTFRISTFFELCREQWRIMNFMPKLEYPGHIAMLDFPKPSEGDAARQKILKDAGWPGTGGDIGVGWDKERARKAMIDYFGDYGPGDSESD